MTPKLERIFKTIFSMSMVVLTIVACDLSIYEDGPSGGLIERLAIWLAFIGAGFVTWIVTSPPSDP
jgi:cyanate permease